MSVTKRWDEAFRALPGFGGGNVCVCVCVGGNIV